MTTTFTSPYPPAGKTDLRPLGYDFRVPFFIIQGENDWEAPTDLAAEYFQHVRAPYKEYIPITGGHWAAMIHMQDFRDLLVAHVRRFATSTALPAQPP
jgi:pimeloyl-ACP methyl ester carboxylesterase